jgi:mono/diheme cytochrome c family protein
MTTYHPPSPDGPAPVDPSTPAARSWSRWLPLLTVAFVGALLPFVMTESRAEAGPTDDQLTAGAEVYQVICQACHQAGGTGLAGSFPPLKDNPNLQDAAYIEDVIRNGRSGELTVNGETYNGVMPAQTALSDDDIVNVIAYIQSGFQAPAGGGEVAVDTGPVAGTDLPIMADYTMLLAFAIALGAVALVLGPRLISAHDRREMTWIDAGLKSGVIVVAMIFGTVWVPSKVLELETVAALPRIAQDVIAVGIWFTALAAGLWALWYAHRERRI